MKHAQGNAPMHPDCICSPMDYAALGHMTNCPRYKLYERTDAEKTAFGEGLQAVHSTQNPYSIDTHPGERHAWHDGYMHAVAKAAGNARLTVPSPHAKDSRMDNSGTHYGT